jgi:hypothetical protein
MRITTVLVLTLLAAAVSAMDELLVPSVYLSPKFTAPPDAPSNIVVAGVDEPGERLVVTGRVIYGSTPIADASLFRQTLAACMPLVWKPQRPSLSRGYMA